MHYVVLRYANGTKSLTFADERSARVFAGDLFSMLQGEEMWKNDDTFHVTAPRTEIY